MPNGFTGAGRMGILESLGFARTQETSRGSTINRIDGIDDHGSTRDIKASQEYHDQLCRDGKIGSHASSGSSSGPTSIQRRYGI